MTYPPIPDHLLARAQKARERAAMETGSATAGPVPRGPSPGSGPIADVLTLAAVVLSGAFLIRDRRRPRPRNRPVSERRRRDLWEVDDDGRS